MGTPGCAQGVPKGSQECVGSVRCRGGSLGPPVGPLSGSFGEERNTKLIERSGRPMGTLGVSVWYT